jgi:hypothetical protein
MFVDVSKQKAKPAPAPNLAALTKEAEEALSEQGLLKLTSIKPPAIREAVVATLVKQGFELTKTHLRIPLAEQLRSALAHGATISISGLPAHVRGATKTELKAAVERAVRDGIVHRVLRGQAESVVAAGAAVLSPELIDRLSARLDHLFKALTKARKGAGLTLLALDVTEALNAAQDVLPKPPNKKSDSAFTAIDRVLQTVDAVRDSQTGLSFVPQVVTQLAKTMDAKAATQALLEAAENDLLELRPEGGLARLTQAELALCPPGPQGTRLSWARRLSGGTP